MREPSLLVPLRHGARRGNNSKSSSVVILGQLVRRDFAVTDILHDRRVREIVLLFSIAGLLIHRLRLCEWRIAVGNWHETIL